MAQDIVNSIFGMNPMEAQQQQMLQLQQRADQYAKMNPFQQATSGLFQAGGMGAGMLAEEAGYATPQMQKAMVQQEAMGQNPGMLDTPEGARAAAKKFLEMGDQRTAFLLSEKARQMEVEQMKVKQADFRMKEEFEWKKEQARAQLEQKAEAARLRSEDMRFSAEQRAAAARESAQMRLLIAQMKSGGNQGMTAGELREQKYKDAKEKEGQAKIDAAKSGLDALESVRRNVNDLYDEKTGKLTPAATTLFGRVDQFRGPLTLSEDSANALSSLTGLKDQITMTNLADAKKMVGQSFGSMQVQEWDKFVRLLSSLDRSIGETKAAENLKYILDFINKKSDVLNVALGGKKPDESNGGWSIRPKGQ